MLHLNTTVTLCVGIKALRGAGFGPRPAARGHLRAEFFLFVAGRYGLRAIPVRCGPGCGPGYGKICGAGWGGPNDIVAGRVRAQLFQPAQFLSKFAHCLCLLVGGLPESSLCVRHCVLLARLHVCDELCCACVHVFIHVCVQQDVVHSCMCVCV